MRILFQLIILILLGSSAFTQQILEKLSNGYVIKFNFQNEISIESRENETIKLDYLFSLDESNPGLPKLPSKIFFVAIPPNSKISITPEKNYYSQINNVNVEINPETYLVNDSVISYRKAEIKHNVLDMGYYPYEEFEVLNYTWIRDFYVAAIRINTHRYSLNEKNLRIIDSCLLKITYSNPSNDFEANNLPLSLFDDMLRDVIINYYDALKFRSHNSKYIVSDTTGNWIDYSKEYLKLAIPKDNIYRITYNDLISFGVNPALINPKTFKLFVRGKEQPIFVAGENDNSFDTTDYIEFYAERNYTYQDYRQIVNIGEDYIQFMNRYSDTTIAWLTWDGLLGRRIETINVNPIQTSDTVSSHQVKLHLEQDVRLWYYDPTVPRVQLPFWQENKTWTWLVVGNSGSTSISFNAREFLENTPVRIIARLISYASSGTINAHKHGLSLNRTTPQDTITYNYKQTVNLSGNYNSSQLIQGTNTIRIFGIPTQASFHQSLVDWVDVEYYRRNVAVNDSMKIIIPDSIQNDLRVIRIDNFTNPNDIIIYKIKRDFKKVLNYSILGSNPATIIFIDSVRGGDEYFIIPVTKVSRPILKDKKYFANLRSSTRGADYIIITNKFLQNSANQYKSFIENNYNLRVELIYDNDIYDEFSFGMLEAEAIRSFLVSAYRNWIPPKPTFLTLIGDANYDYKDVTTPAPTPRKKNILTSFGNPVSDVWYVMWDTVNIHFPQMFVGRIPANNDDQVLMYLQKHQKYLQRGFDYFNKSYLFFSGGDATKPSELAQIIAANELVMNSYVKSLPIVGNANHFYKTINPPSNFGPYSLEFVQKTIDEGGLFISYIGHSGTRTWDNSITEVEHIKNKYNDRFPLISDFGCSTGKFAEPDVDAFGELFICQSPNGQAITYLGNSSWGYLSTSLRFPKLFYEILMRDSLKGIGRAHTLAKIRQINETGAGDVNRVFTYCNLLFGDPIIGLQVPNKPNFVMDGSKIKLLTSQPNDQLDSIKFMIVISNLGIVNGDSIKIEIRDSHNDTLLTYKLLTIPFIRFQDTLIISLPVANKVGTRILSLKIDPENLIDEIYEDDNVSTFNYVINSTSLNSIEVSDAYNTFKQDLIVLNPLISKKKILNRLILELSTSKDFNQVQTFFKDLDTLFTKINLSSLNLNQRYYYRLRLDEQNAYWSKTISFYQGFPNYITFVDKPLNDEQNYNLNQVFYDTLSRAWRLSSKLIALKILSGGGHDGAFGSIQWNGYEQLPNTYYWGLATAIIDSITLKPISIRYFNVPDPGVSDSLTNFVNQLSPGRLIAMTISADAAQNVLGYSGGTPPRNAIKTLGSLYIDSIRYREGWCILGKKGAPIGSVPEDYKKLFTGVAQIEVSKEVTYDSGYVIFPEMKFSAKWNYIKVETERPENTNIIYIPLGIRKNSQVDTLYDYQTSLDSIDLSGLDAKIYPTIRLMAKLYANSYKESPKIYSVGASYEPVPELAVNYQTVQTDKDTFTQGEMINYIAKIFNVGKTSADTFKVILELIKDDNSSYILIDSVINQLLPNSSITLNYQYINKIYDGFGNFAFKLTIDADDAINEFFEENNVFIKSFYIKKDTTTAVSEAAVSVLFNGREIRDWEYVEPQSRIEIKINYPVWFPVNDTSAVQIYFDGQRIYSHQLVYDYDTIERKLNIVLEPQLTKGEHNLRIYLKNAFGRISSQPVIDKYFKVTSNLEILQVYNYPNPFNNGTYFTFILTQIPDEIQIKIYTVAGRLIKEIHLTSSELSTNFNKVFWDGRDADGDFLGNGVYLYKIIAKKGEQTQTRIQKLAVVR